MVAVVMGSVGWWETRGIRGMPWAAGCRVLSCTACGTVRLCAAVWCCVLRPGRRIRDGDEASTGLKNMGWDEASSRSKNMGIFDFVFVCEIGVKVFVSSA